MSLRQRRWILCTADKDDPNRSWFLASQENLQSDLCQSWSCQVFQDPGSHQPPHWALQAIHCLRREMSAHRDQPEDPVQDIIRQGQ